MKITEPEKKDLTDKQSQSIISKEGTLKEIVVKVSPAVDWFTSQKLSGEITLQFLDGKLQRALAKPVKHL